jgi:PAS domain S-box-containing protein
LWVGPAFALTIVISLFSLGVANIVLRARTTEVDDGVLWRARVEGVTAVEVASGSTGDRAGIVRGDVLIAVNGMPVRTPADVYDHHHGGRAGLPLAYTMARLGSRQIVVLALAPVTQATSMYFVLAGVGLFTLLVGAWVRLRRPNDEATLHFFWLCAAFFGWFTFSFNGALDRLDWVFYWGDAIATAIVPPLLLHFALVFPERPPWRRRSLYRMLAPIMYVPAVLLAAGRIVVIARGTADGPMLSRALGALDRIEPFYFTICVVAAAFVLASAFREITSETGRRQLRWIAWGSLLGIGPFVFGYAIPWAVGIDPPLALQLTAIPLGLVPLTFASALVRYRLRDVEIIIKGGLVYAAFFGASAYLYVAMRKLTGFAVGDELDSHNWIIALLATMVIVLVLRPVKDAVQDALDRAFYRDRYDYRRALVAFARDLNSDLDVVRLSRQLVSRTVDTLGLDRMALMLADERLGDFRAIGDFGFSGTVPPLTRDSSFLPRLDAGHTVALDDPTAAARFTAEDVEWWRDNGIEHFVPCVFEGSAIAVLALGRKDTDEPFNSEDFGLLTAVAGQVATAIENGRLYRQLHLKAEELDRMREFNENILESLDDGLAVFDEAERVLRWNRALEGFYGLARADAIGRSLAEVFDEPFIDALRAAQREHPRGATLFRVPLTSRKAAAGEPDAPARLMVNAAAVPLEGPGGHTGGTILLIEDVTDRMRLEEQLQISEKMAAIGLLAAGVAHEVNTPLTGISSFTQMLLEGADPRDPKTALLEKIERQTFRAARIVNGLLTLSRPGTPGAERTEVDVNRVLTDVFSLVEHQFEAGRIRVRRELSGVPVIVSGVEHRLQQVFLNLLLNARDAMPRGGWLTVTTRADGAHMVAEIADTGSGIPPEQLARIYDPFFTTKPIGRGTGLGLSITYGIVQQHGGSIRCDSAPGQGTRFTVMLPQAAAVARSAAQ